MATVRITSSIRFHVKEKLEELYNEQIDRKKKELLNLDIGNTCYEHYVPAKYRELAQQLNTDIDGQWIETKSDIGVYMRYLTDDVDPVEKKVYFTVSVNPPIPLPIRFREYGTEFELLETMAPYEHAKKIWLEIDRMLEERNKLIHQLVRDVLTKCVTLRQVLEVWPTALDFMPDYVKQRHATQTKKRQSTKNELSIDDDVKVSLMKARMLAAGG